MTGLPFTNATSTTGVVRVQDLNSSTHIRSDLTGTRMNRMKYTILVNEGAYQHQSADSALQFARATGEGTRNLSQCLLL
ncbi:MAG: hypothetical protein R3E93_01840 [Thiothrix sp.]